MSGKRATRMRIRFLQRICMILFFAGSLHAGQGMVQGSICDISGMSVSDAEVTLSNTERTIIRRTLSNAIGEYVFADLPPARYTLSIHRSGFAEIVRNIVLEAGTAIREDFRLNLGTLRETITVTAIRGEAQPVFSIPEFVGISTGREMERRAFTILPQALRQEPGLHLQQTTTSQGSTYVRGLTGQQVVNLIDGMRFNNATFRPGANQYTAFVDPSFMDRIEVVHGPNSVQYGSDALGGAINMLTRPVQTSDYGFRLNGGMSVFIGTADLSGGGSLQLSGGGSKWGFAAEASGRRIQDLRPGQGVDSHSVATRLLGLPSSVLGHRLQDTGYAQFGGFGKFVFRPSSPNTFSVQYMNGKQIGARRYDQLNGGAGNMRNRFDPQILNFFSFRYERAGLWKLDSLSAGFSYNGQTDDREYQNINNNKKGLKSTISREHNLDSAFGYTIQASKIIRRRNTIAAGMDFYDEYIKSTRMDFPYNAPETGFSNGTSVRARFPNNARYRSLGVFAQDLVTIIPQRLSGTFGLRFSRFLYSQTPDGNPADSAGNQTVPRYNTAFKNVTYNAGLVFSLTGHLNLTGTVSRGFRAPDVADFGTIGISGNGFEVSPEEARRLGGSVGSFDAAKRLIRPAKRITRITPERLQNYEIGIRLQTKLLDASFAGFSSEISDFIERGVVLLKPGAVGSSIGGQQILKQDASGAVYTSLSNNPVFVRSNGTRMRLRGFEAVLALRMPHGLSLNMSGFHIRATDLDTNEPPSVENGIPPATGFAGLRWEPSGHRFWIEPCLDFALAQRRLSDNDRTQARIGGMRTRDEIVNFFNNGAVARGLVHNGILVATGENANQVAARVLGPNLATGAPMFLSNPGFGIFSLRGGYRLLEKSRIVVILENVFDRNYRTMGSGVDGPGFNLMVRYSVTF
ncbi:MAG: TonB-dependent receptor [Acidobacteriota bacterium]|nr:TonB-dependent receptor [Acidobacteriota bacterium]